MKKFLAILALALSFAACKKNEEGCYTPETVPDPKKSPSKIFLSDPDTLVDSYYATQINTVCWEIEQQTGVQVAVVIMRSACNDMDSKTFASDLFNTWKIGQAGKDNGLLILTIVDQKRWEFETGYGIESVLTDVECKTIGEYNLVPYYKQNQYGLGLSMAVSTVKTRLIQGGIILRPDAYAKQYIDSLSQPSDTSIPSMVIPSSPMPNYSSGQPYESTINENYMSASQVHKRWMNSFWIFMLAWMGIAFFWWFITYKKGKNKEFPARKPNKILLALLLFVPLLMWAFMPDTIIKNGYAEAYTFFGVYVAVMLLITEYRVRCNKEIFRRGQDVYLTYSDFRKSHSVWTFIMPVLFPLIYIPYLFWYYARCNEMRKRSRPCKKCGNELHYKENVISELEDDKYLNKGQVKEEYLTSRDWDVWLCKSCSQVEVLGYKAYFTSYDNCPRCSFITEKYLGSQTITPATYTSTGSGIKKYQCSNCGNYREVSYTIPMKTRSSSSGGSGGGGGGGSSWGGGRSGGGGAGGGW